MVTGRIAVAVVPASGLLAWAWATAAVAESTVPTGSPGLDVVRLVLGVLAVLLLGAFLYVVVRIGAARVRRQLQSGRTPSRMHPKQWQALRLLRRRPDNSASDDPGRDDHA